MHFSNLSSCCAWLLWDWAFLLCVLLEILRGNSSFASAVKPALLTFFCAHVCLSAFTLMAWTSYLVMNSPPPPPTHTLISLSFLLQVGLCLALFCRVENQMEVSRFSPIFPVMVIEDDWWWGGEDIVYIYTEGTAFGTNITLSL